MLSFQLSCCNHDLWAHENFSDCKLKHPARRRRVVKIAMATAENPGDSIPMAFDHPYDIKAAYKLFDHKEATPDNIQHGHRRRTREKMRTPGRTILLIEDSTDCSWSGNKPVDGLGPIGSGGKGLQGFRLHSSLAVGWPGLPAPDDAGRRPPVEILGLADQTYHVREPRPEGEEHGERWKRQRRARESQWWDEMTQRLGPAPKETHWERVCDREADIYEFIRGCLAAGHGFTVRAAQNRRLVTPDGEEAQYLFDEARRAESWGQFDLRLRERESQPSRVARLSVSACAVTARSPQLPDCAAGSRPPVACTVVRVWEADPPEGAEPLEWVLLHDRPVATFEEALQVALKYSCRWLIEEFHKALKTGMGAERLQLEKARRLFAAVAIMSVTALRLIDLRERVRDQPDAPAEQSGLTRIELRVLRARWPERAIVTVRDAALAIGRMGGHMNRKSDGLPGWMTLWRGLKKLHLLTQGYMLDRSVKELG